MVGVSPFGRSADRDPKRPENTPVWAACRPGQTPLYVRRRRLHGPWTAGGQHGLSSA